MLRLAFFLIALSFALPAAAQLPNPFQPQLDFESLFVQEVEKAGDTSKLTSTQKKEAWNALEDRLTDKIGTKPWVITLKVEDVKADADKRTDKAHEITFASTIELQGAKCKWRFASSEIK